MTVRPPPSPRIYQQVADRITEQIHSGVLPPGSKVPSLRLLSRQMGFNMATIQRAYWMLENRGVLESRPSSGFYVRSAATFIAAEPQAEKWNVTLTPVSMTQAMREVESFHDIVKLFADPHQLHLIAPCSEQFPKALWKILSLGYQRAGLAGMEGYPWPPGNLLLRRQVSRHYLDCGLVLPPEEILTTIGGTESLMVALKCVTQPGDIVALESPLFPSLLTVVKALGLKSVEIPLDPKEGMDLDALRRTLRRYRVKACVSIPNFNWPMGCLMPDANKKRLVEMLSQKKVTLIENDEMGDLYFGEQRPRPAKAFDRTGNVILCSSFSKTLGEGLRVGWLSGGKLHSRAVGYKFSLNIGCNPATEWSLGYFMEKGFYQRHLRKMRKYYAAALPLFTQALTRHLPEGTRISRPAGGFILWVEFPPMVDTTRLFKEAPHYGVVLISGNYYTLHNRFPHHAGFNFGNPLSEKLEKALKVVGDLAKKQLAEKK